MVKPVFINIGGVKYNQNALTVSVGRKFREAWVVKDGVVELDATKATDIVKDAIDDYAEYLCSNGIIWNGNEFGYKNTQDMIAKLILFDMVDGNGPNPHAGYIKDKSGNRTTLTKVQAKDLLGKFRTYGMQVIQTSHDAKDALPTNPAELEEFDPATDITWPSNTFTY